MTDEDNLTLESLKIMIAKKQLNGMEVHKMQDGTTLIKMAMTIDEMTSFLNCVRHDTLSVTPVLH